MNKKNIIFLLIGVLFTSFNLSSIAFNDEDEELFHPKRITDGISISVNDCVASAFKNSPKIRRKKYELDIAKSNVGIARSAYFPVINTGVGFYNENNSDATIRYYRELPNVGVSINKMVWDFGRTTANIKMEEFYKLGAEYEFMDSLCSTLFDVKIKYYNLLKAKALLVIAQNNKELNKYFADIARAQPDLTTAKLNLSESEVKLLEAQNDLYNAKINLDNSMYLENQPSYEVINTKTFNFDNDYSYFNNKEPNIFEKYNFSFSREDAVKLAYENSPDLMVLESTRNAMKQSLKYIKKTYLPALSAGVGYGFNNTTEHSNNSLQVGVNLSSNVNVMELKHSIKSVDAQIELAENEITLFKKDLFYEVKRAFNNFDKSERQIPIAQMGAKQALENLKLVEIKYRNNELSYIALQDARKDYINSLNSYVETIYNYNIALIQIEMAMHYHIVDIHHKTEHAMCYHSEALINHLNEVLDCNRDEEKFSKKIKKHKFVKEDL